MKPYTLAIAALLTAAPVFAQTPSDESVQKLITVTQQEKMLDGMMDTMAEPMRQHVVSSLPEHLTKQLSPEQKQRLEAAAISLYDKTLQLYKQPEFKEKLITLVRQVYQKHYSQEEVDYMIRYLDNPIGQRVLAKQKDLVAAIMTESMTLFQMENDKNSQKLIADFVAEAKAIVGETPKPVRKPAKKSQPRKSKP